jgi:hypothetical protein
MNDSDVVIRVEGVAKKYSLNHEQSERYTALLMWWPARRRPQAGC